MISEATTKLCPICEDPVTVCNGEGSQSCWRNKAIRAETRASARILEMRVQLENRDTTDAENFAVGQVVAKLHRILDESKQVGTFGDPELQRLAERITKLLQPIPMRIPCIGTIPDGHGGLKVCGELHIDEGDFATKPHHTHSCQACGMTWRPAVVPTVGVRFLPGFLNTPKGSQ